MTNTTRRRAKYHVIWAGVIALTGGGGAAVAQDLSLPATAQRSFHTQQDPGAYALPTGPWADGILPTQRIEGRVEVESWRIPNAGLSPFQLMKPLRDALSAADYHILLDCAAQRCGGFDFRFSTLVLPAPEMFVSLDNYHFVSARSVGGGAVSILTSQGPRDGYVQIIRAGNDLRAEVTNDAAAPAAAAPLPTNLPPRAPIAAQDLTGALEALGHVVLSDLVFQPGSSALGDGAIGSLDTLAAYLAANPGRRIVFVGHTDATGSLSANRRVSQQRAEAAVTYLRQRHGTANGQISAEGAGYLAPIGSNLTEVGRDMNRRVEAVLISTE